MGRKNRREDTPRSVRNPAAVLDGLGARWSPNFHAYASGDIDASQLVCVLCEDAPCACGSAAGSASRG